MLIRPFLAVLLLPAAILHATAPAARAAESVAAAEAAEKETPGGPDAGAFFTERVDPILRERCFGCHSHDTEMNGGLALDVRSGWEKGGRSGPAVVPGNPNASLLVAAVTKGVAGKIMPPDDPLPDEEIATLVEWVRRGAPDPRRTTAGEAWDRIYRRRLEWWSLKPVEAVAAPTVKDDAWPKSPVDRFILARLEAAGRRPAPPASPRQLVRRLAFSLTGLPPTPAEIEAHLADDSADAYERLVDRYLDSPHFGERWARHWMDVVHYADSHGYEWDVPAKHAWRYRDYLVRAFNADLPYDRLVLEQIAGDLLPPRIDAATGVNEAVIGTMALRMGERWHGDNAAAEATTAQNLGDSVDTATKAFLGTTVGCARCHDHKLDAISQADYYAVYGTLFSSRWGVRGIDTVDPNVPVIETLRGLKESIRRRLADRWLSGREDLLARLRRFAEANAKEAKEAKEEPDGKADGKPKPEGFPESLAALLRRSADSPVTPASFAEERGRRVAANAAGLELLADFTSADPAAANGWRWDGFGMRHGLVRDGEPVIADEGDAAVVHLLPAGRWSHAYSARLGGVVLSPELFRDPPLHFSVGRGAGRKASYCLIVDRAFHSERVKYAEAEPGQWLSLKAGEFSRLAGAPDTAPRRVYFELATKSYNNYFPPRTNYNGLTAADEAEPRSWCGVTKVHAHPPDQPPRDELGRFVGLLDSPVEPGRLTDRVADHILAAVGRWAEGRCTSDDVPVLNEALREGWLDHATSADPELAAVVARYREAERKLVPDRTIGGLDDWQEGADAAIAVRGEPAQRGDRVPRGTIRFLESIGGRPGSGASGRLELARSIADPRNPLAARVFVNRVWLHCFGEGLVRTPDDFGHLGDRPSHPELLDFLALRFVEEGWSLKKLVRMLVTSETFRQSSTPDAEAVAIDPENRLWHHVPRRRLEAEEIRDAMLAVAGRLDPTVGGEPVDPFRAKEDPAKRLMSGPLDGRGRRSLYLRMTLMEPPRFLATFNQPSPQVTTGRRDRSTVPDQALTLLNDPFVHAMARAWADRTRSAGKADGLRQGIAQMCLEGLGRPASQDEIDRLVELAEACAASRGAAGEKPDVVLQDVAHAIVLLPEFTHVE